MFDTIVFPVAGLGTRMAPASKYIAKEMLFILDKPIIHFSIQEALEAGFRNMIFIVRPGKESIKQYVSEFFPKVHSVFIEQKNPQGLGDAILKAETVVSSDFAISLPDDIIWNCNSYTEMLENYNGGNMVAVMSVRPEEAKRYGIFKNPSIKQNIVLAGGLVEKPESVTNTQNYAVIGRYLLNYKIFDFLKSTVSGKLGEVQLSDAIDNMIYNGYPLSGCILSGKRLDCGDMNGFAEAYFSILFSLDKYKKMALDLLGVEK